MASNDGTDLHNVTLTCPICGKEFSGNRSHSGVQSNYRRHLLVHSHERPFKCRFCGDGFTTRQNMKRHVRARHPELASPLPAARRSTVTVTTTSSSPNNRALTSAQPASASPPLHNTARSTTTVIPPFALPTSTTASVPPSEAAECCRRCGRYFAFRATRLLHEETCSDAPLANSAMANATRGNNNNKSEKSSPSRGVDDNPEAVVEPSSKPTEVFVCEDCELEVSSRSKLRRHQQYYCPFRENVFADPLTDVVVRADNRRGEKVAQRLAAQTGMRYVRNANEDSDDNDSKGSASSQDDGGSSDEDDSDDDDDESISEEETPSLSGGDHNSPQSLSGSEDGDAPNGAAGSGPDEVWAEEKLHLDYHRRRSGHKRQRRILRKRLTAQQRQNQEEVEEVYSVSEDDDDHEAKRKREVTWTIRSHGGDTSDTYKDISGEGVAYCSEPLRRNAEALLLSGHQRKPLAVRISCPFDSCLQVFASRRLWIAHVARCHPDMYESERL